MSLSIGLLMILTGLAIMAFGLFMFYAWLPLLYALIGLDVGLLLGRAFTGDVGTTAIVLGLASALILGAASYILEPYRRVLLGVSGGILFGLSVAAAFGLDGWFWQLLRQSARVSLRRGRRFACAAILRFICYRFICRQRCSDGDDRRKPYSPRCRIFRPCHRRRVAIVGHNNSGRHRRELATQQHRKVDSNVVRWPRRFRCFDKRPERTVPTLILEQL